MKKRKMPETTIWHAFRPSGFTLVELLVVMAIIGVLIGMLFPAVQSIRESARRTECLNNLKQQTLALQLHDTAFRRYPSGGWGYNWVGDPDRGTGLDQPGGWIYSSLPYVEQKSLYQVAGDGDSKSVTFDQAEGAIQLMSTQVAIYECPSRRRGDGPFTNHQRWLPRNVKNAPGWSSLVADGYPKSARSDYAANSGDKSRIDNGGGTPGGPLTLADGDDPTYPWPDVSKWTGIFMKHTTVRTKQITDGMSNTLLVGEKYMDPADYYSGEWFSDNECMFIGSDIDIHRWTNPLAPDNRPYRDGTRKGGSHVHFGSAHPGGCNFSFADGSTRVISYDVDHELYRRLGNRRDGQIVDQSQF